MRDKFCIVIGGKVEGIIRLGNKEKGEEGFVTENNKLPPELLYFGKDFKRAHKVALESSVYYNTRLLITNLFIAPLDNQGNVRDEILNKFEHSLYDTEHRMVSLTIKADSMSTKENYAPTK